MTAFRYWRVRALQLVLAALAAGMTITACGGDDAPPPCDRGCLLAEAERLARAQAAPDAGARITENGAVVAWGAASPARLRSIAIHARAADAERQSAIVYGTADDGGRPAVFSLRTGRRDGKVVRPS